jgi:hypothetical protein
MANDMSATNPTTQAISRGSTIARITPHLTSWPSVLVVLLIVRLSLQVPALLGARFMPAEAASAAGGLDRTTLPGVWWRWDSGYYLSIAAHGYPYQGPEVNFWPGYPLAIRLLSLGQAPAMPWAAVALANVSFLLASLLLWEQVKSDLGWKVAWGTVLTLSLFPTSFFFSAIYSESLFLLFSVLVYWFSARGRFGLAAVFVALASITRIYGILLLVLLLVEMASSRRRQAPLKVALIVGAASSLLVLYAGFLWLSQGSPLAALSTQQELMKRSVTFPGISLLHSLAVAAWGYGGFRDNWFMRVVSVQDSLAMLLFLACSVAGLFVLRRRSLGLYGGVAMLALMASHGPYTLGTYSMSRYVLQLFPAFMVMGMVTARFPKLGALVWIGMAALLWLLTAWFASGRWVA